MHDPIVLFKVVSDFTSKGSRRNNGWSQERKETQTNVSGLTNRRTASRKLYLTRYKEFPSDYKEQIVQPSFYSYAASLYFNETANGRSTKMITLLTNDNVRFLGRRTTAHAFRVFLCQTLNIPSEIFRTQAAECSRGLQRYGCYSTRRNQGHSKTCLSSVTLLLHE